MPTSISNNLRAERVARNLTQEQAAQLIGCSRPTLNKIENHHREPSAKFMLDAAAAFGKPVESLFYREAVTVTQRALRIAVATGRALGVMILTWFVISQLVGRAAFAAAPYVQNDAARQTLAIVGMLATSPVEGLWVAQTLTASDAVPSRDDCSGFIRRAATLGDIGTDNPLAVPMYDRLADCLDRTGNYTAARSERETILRIEALGQGRYSPARAQQYAVVTTLMQAGYAIRYGDVPTARELLADAGAISAPWTAIFLGEFGATAQPATSFMGDMYRLLALDPDPGAHAFADLRLAQLAVGRRDRAGARSFVDRAFAEAPRALANLLVTDVSLEPEPFRGDRTRDYQALLALRTPPTTH